MARTPIKKSDRKPLSDGRKSDRVQTVYPPGWLEVVDSFWVDQGYRSRSELVQDALAAYLPENLTNRLPTKPGPGRPA